MPKRTTFPGPSTLPSGSVQPGGGQPARVVITPAEVILRIALPSERKRLPAASPARLCGPFNRASVPVPSVAPCFPGAPTKVVTAQSVPDGVIFRIVKLLVSATYKLPELSRVRPNGPLNRAATPMPSFVPGAHPAQPATVVTTQFAPRGAIFRTVLLKNSTT